MTKLGLTAVVAVALAPVATATTLARAEADNPEKVDAWFSRLSHTKLKTTRLRFYFHDTLSGKSPTAVRVAKAAMTKKSWMLFRAVNIIDDPLTEGLEPESPLVGSAQGFYGSTGLESVAPLMDMNLVFTSPNYNGSTLSILGRNLALETYQELPIVGGTGIFRLASGIATAKKYFVVEYNVIAMHY
ncbi:hypothetical protein ACJRO7_034957 [Eucalyptus globulus]|uniref:Dirigent protein n=1 Tax=Eucalyptus globulus TaxID=34317 RepID=A0ABD3J5A3_EUCGL